MFLKQKEWDTFLEIMKPLIAVQNYRTRPNSSSVLNLATKDNNSAVDKHSSAGFDPELPEVPNSLTQNHKRKSNLNTNESNKRKS
jgi:hypothetical protein